MENILIMEIVLHATFPVPYVLAHLQTNALLVKKDITNQIFQNVRVAHQHVKHVQVMD